jgi:hypothetical protein
MRATTGLCLGLLLSACEGPRATHPAPYQTPDRIRVEAPVTTRLTADEVAVDELPAAAPAAPDTAPRFRGGPRFAKLTATSVEIGWDAAEDAEGGALSYRVVGADSPDELDGDADLWMPWTQDVTSWSVTGLSDYTTYWFVVWVRDAAGLKTRSEVASIRTLDGTAPDIREELVFSSLGAREVDVQWSGASDRVTNAAKLRYRVVVATNPESIDEPEEIAALDGSALLLDWHTAAAGMHVDALLPGTTYYFAVAVRDEAGNESLYAPAGVTTLPE